MTSLAMQWSPQSSPAGGVLLLDWKKNEATLAPHFRAWKTGAHALAPDYDIALLVPPGQALLGLLRLDWELTETGKNRSLVAVGENAHLKILISMQGTGRANSTVIVGPGATLELVFIHSAGGDEEFGLDTHSYHDAQLTNAHVWLGTGVTNAQLTNTLEEIGAHIRHIDIAYLSGRQQLNEKLLLTHKVPHGTSRSIMKTVLFDESRVSFDGKIKVLPGAQKTDAMLQAHSSLLSSNARSVVVPSLEIEANDVKCTHAATSREIGPDQKFYLHSRGIGPKTAEGLIVQSFLESATQPLSEEARQAIDEKIGAVWAHRGER